MRPLTEAEIDELIRLQSELTRAIFYQSYGALKDLRLMIAHAKDFRAKATRDLKKFYMEHQS